VWDVSSISKSIVFLLPICRCRPAGERRVHRENVLVTSIETAPLSSGRALRRLRIALAAGVASLLVAGISADGAARGMAFPYGWYGDWYAPAAPIPSRKARVAPSRRQKSESKKEAGFGEMPKGPLQIVVSIEAQRVTLFSNGVRVAQGPVSTGVLGHPTPMGVFSIIEKDRYHHSNLYSNAPMPYMQRITWSGVALHEGVLPGYPASHGCIRMSHDFAQKLWRVTKLGVRVIVARHELAPIDFAHPNLFRPKPKPAEPSIAIGVTDGRSPTPAVVSRAEIAQTDSDHIGAPPQAAAERPPADAAAYGQATDAPAAEQASEGAQTGGLAGPVQVIEVPAARSDAGDAPEIEQKSESAPGGGSRAAPRPSDAAPSVSERPQPAPAVDPAKPPRIKAAEELITRSGQVAVFVSRKEQRIYVRQGFVPLFDMPLVIEQPDQPLGTHVFTAMEVTENGGGMRWNVMTMPAQASAAREQRDAKKRSKASLNSAPKPKPAATPAEALDRIQMPQEAVERIGELLIPGSSLVVSDEGLGPETGRYTEFIVLAQ
jgi:lipoprotein-anchoring transpeptidase ErfK/SrfK